MFVFAERFTRLASIMFRSAQEAACESATKVDAKKGAPTE